jgi:large subunit ribosomal protein L3
MKYVLGIKKGMTRIYDGYKSVTVSVVDQDGCVVSLVTDKGYELGLGKKKNSNKALAGKYSELGFVPRYRMWITDSSALENLKVGDKAELEMGENESFEINVKGVSKGKGFAGVVKRYKFAGGPKTHGQSDRERAPGSIGAGTDPGRVFKGKRMGGRMGTENITIKNKKIVDIRDTFVLVSGAIPGAKGNLVVLEIKD